MEILQVKKRGQSDSQQLTVPFVPDELIAEILSFLNVKTIMQLKCVSKSWNSLINDSTFVQKHLKKSSQNPHIILTPPTLKYPISSVESFPVSRLLENPSITVFGDNFHDLNDTCQVIGSCNGLFCLIFHSLHRKYTKYWFCLWNPATRTISEELGTFRCYNTSSETFKFGFGCDISTGTYKLVAYRAEEDDANHSGSWRSQVRIFSLSDNCWRNIESFPLIPIGCIQINRNNNGVHLSGKINWLVIRNYFCASYHYECMNYVEQFVIVSLDLSTETYTQFLLPFGFDEVPHFQPTLHVLMDCLCFSHDFKGTEFVIWQMKKFGVQESWTLLFRIDYFNLEMYNLTINYDTDFDAEFIESCTPPLLPLYLSKNDDTLILANYEDDRAIIYNLRDKRVERVKISSKLCWFSAMDYAESLISTHWKSATPTPSTLSVDRIVAGIGDIRHD
ncbi:putative F-box domain-containing protein [Medicago truncatula]|uniref:F-box protein interaction domain protein n=1 Tax=Medicago truncatula TaxID=3880 RepID=G7KLX9_MEDTR|nr:putative F-box protein At1g33530 [Medicago truncatula]AES75691.1 F-box protein interaction domain protein [Medicago truncatula]RHN51624.1 putative F-box domain-containing protein [Medicago truncatula]